MTKSFPPRRREPRKPARVKGPDPLDVHVGARVKLRRLCLGLSQGQLAESIDLTFQQVQKYEKGANRISASMLYRLADRLDVPVSFFFDDLPDGRRLPSVASDDLIRGESVELVRNYYAIPEASRRQVYQLVKTMAQDSTGR